jgi:Type IX secretion system membrane protein PorP/SprF
MAFSYALPLDYDNTYLAAGFQAAYTFSQISLDNYSSFPGSFDRYGAIGSAILADPYQSGYEYDYFTAGVGVAVFHSGQKKQWFVGGSIRNLNQPYTEWTHSFRLSMNSGIQASYTTALNHDDAICGYGYFNWEGAVHEQFIGTTYTRNLDDSSRYELSAGLAYRVGDALIPSLGIKFGDNRIGFYYEFNIFGNSLSFYNRTAFEFSYSLVL